MTKLQEYFHTDWSAMTGTDWFGLVLTVSVFIILVIAFFWTYNPKNKEELESHRTMLLDDENDIKSEK